MQATFVRLIITIVAAGIFVFRMYRPDVHIDSANLALLSMAVLPWLPSIVKGFELPGGVKVELPEQRSGSDAVVARKEAVESIQSAEASQMPTVAWPGEHYFARVLKLSPLELIVPFILTNAMVHEVQLTASPALLWGNFFAFLLLTPFYFRAQGVGATQLIILTVGFLTWVFALGGPFILFKWYRPLFGALGLAVFTFISPLLYFDDKY